MSGKYNDIDLRVSHVPVSRHRKTCQTYITKSCSFFKLTICRALCVNLTVLPGSHFLGFIQRQAPLNQLHEQLWRAAGPCAEDHLGVFRIYKG